MNPSNTLSSFIDLLLKFAVIFYIIPFFYEAAMNTGFDKGFWDTFIKIILIVVFLGISIINLLLSRGNFYIFGFFIVTLGTLYSILNLVFSDFKFSELPVHILLLVVSFYFLTRDKRKHRTTS